MVCLTLSVSMLLRARRSIRKVETGRREFSLQSWLNFFQSFFQTSQYYWCSCMIKHISEIVTKFLRKFITKSRLQNTKDTSKIQCQELRDSPLDVPWVWSTEGPVFLLGVLPFLRVQSNWSRLDPRTFSQPQRPCSKVHEMLTKSERNEGKKT